MSLVSYWPLHENSGSTAYDVRGGNDGTTYGGVTQGATGVLGNTAYDFDGTDDEIALGTVSISEFTIAAWVKFDVKDGAYGWTVNLRDGYYLNIGKDNNDAINWYYRDSGGSNFDVTYASSNWNTGQWYLQVMTCDGSTAKAYFDNELIASASQSGHTDQGGTNNIGSSGGGNFHNGSIAEVRIYDHALTASEVQYLYSVSQHGQLTSSWKQA